MWLTFDNICVFYNVCRYDFSKYKYVFCYSLNCIHIYIY